VVREASKEWAVLVEQFYHALDHDRIEFRDVTGRCSVASAGAAALGLGVCILIAPEIAVGSVIVVGVVVVAVAIKRSWMHTGGHLVSEPSPRLKRGHPMSRIV
jgi:hypothetical protein